MLADIKKDIVKHRKQRSDQAFIKSIFEYAAKMLDIKRLASSGVVVWRCVDEYEVNKMVSSYRNFLRDNDAEKSIELAIFKAADENKVTHSLDLIEEIANNAKAKWNGTYVEPSFWSKIFG